MERTTNFMNNVRTIARKNQFQYMVLENFIEREIPKNKTYWLFGARFPFAEYKMEA